MSNETTSEEKTVNVFGTNCLYETVYQLSNRDFVSRIICYGFHRILSA